VVAEVSFQPPLQQRRATKQVTWLHGFICLIEIPLYRLVALSLAQILICCSGVLLNPHALKAFR